ncbi:MAG: ammonium transporter [Amphiplicatus sp.]
MTRARLTAFFLILLCAGAPPAFAQGAGLEIQSATDTSRYIFSTLFLLISGILVMFMAAGFCMREAGLGRAKNAGTICLKNIAVYSIAGLMVWLVGYNLIYGVEKGGLLGAFAIWGADDSDPLATGRAASADWHFQMVFVAMAALIVSGALAERVKLWSFLIFTALLTGIIYPIEAGWEWGGGYLDAAWSFSDFAGSTLVHSTGGWAALAGALVLGPRLGKYEHGETRQAPGSNLPLAVLGTFILWLGWFGFNGGAQLALGAIPDAIAVANIFVNTNSAASAGVVTAMALTQIIYKKIDLAVVLNGAIGGLVSITGEPLAPTIAQAVLIGAIGGVIVTVAVPMLDRLKIVDVVGAIPAHLFCGVWGTIIVPWSNSEASFFGQLVGVMMIGAFVFVLSLLVWLALKYTLGVRVAPEHERFGLDRVELGLEAYPEFSQG